MEEMMKVKRRRKRKKKKKNGGLSRLSSAVGACGVEQRGVLFTDDESIFGSKNFLSGGVRIEER